MFLRFEEYTSINEEKAVKTFNEIELNSHWKTYAEMKRNFTAKGYEFLGTVFCESKSYNNFKPDGFKAAFTGRMEDFVGLYKDTTLSVDLVPGDGDDSGYRRFDSVLSENNIDEVTLCESKSGKRFYVFFNRDKKYFFFLNTRCSSPMLDMWLRIRTSGEDVVYGELCTEREIRKAELEKKREEERIGREEEERNSALRKDRDEEYETFVNMLKDDVGENPDRYKDVKYWYNLPEDMQEAIKSGIRDSGFVECYEKDPDYFSPYDYERYTVYINDRSMTRGYKYNTEVFTGKPGTNLGD